MKQAGGLRETARAGHSQAFGLGWYEQRRWRWSWTVQGV